MRKVKRKVTCQSIGPDSLRHPSFPQRGKRTRSIGGACIMSNKQTGPESYVLLSCLWNNTDELNL